MGVYKIIVKSHLNNRRMSTFTGMTIRRLPQGYTELTGHLPDQAALYGVIGKIQELGIDLVQVIAENEQQASDNENLGTRNNEKHF